MPATGTRLLPFFLAGGKPLFGPEGHIWWFGLVGLHSGVRREPLTGYMGEVRGQQRLVFELISISMQILMGGKEKAGL